MPRLGALERGVDGSRIRHLSQDDNIRVLTERGFEPYRETLGVDADLPLSDRALEIPVQELDGILDGDHVLVQGTIDVVHHSGHGGALAAAAYARDEHQTTVRLGHDLEHVR